MIEGNIDARNLDLFQQSLTEYAAASEEDAHTSMRHQARLLAMRLVRLTPPSKMGQGKKRVARDIRRAMRPLRPIDFDNKSISNLIRKRDYDALRVIFERSGSNIKEMGPFDASKHIDAQKDGSVRRATGYATADVKELNAYIRRKQGNVGKAKGGWAAGVMKFNGRVASWISKHVGEGSVTDNIATDGTITLRNHSAWASNHSKRDAVINTALSERARDIHIYLKARQQRLMSKMRRSA